ncbi:MAG: hypothetical protein WKF30_09420 [Pyrinomonadaceae bacterium]
MSVATLNKSVNSRSQLDQRGFRFNLRVGQSGDLLFGIGLRFAERHQRLTETRLPVAELVDPSSLRLQALVALRASWIKMSARDSACASSSASVV